MRNAPNKTKPIPVFVHPDGNNSVPIDPVPIFGAGAVSLAARMSKQQWLLAKKNLPTYTRSEIPIVFLPARTGNIHYHIGSTYECPRG